VLIEGETGTVATKGSVHAYVGMAPELWAADALAFFRFLTALYKDQRFGLDAFDNRANFFAKRNVLAIVLEVPNELVAKGKVHGWATTSLFGHAPETQVYRWGLPLLTHLYLSGSAELAEKFHEAPPFEDDVLFRPAMTDFVTQLVTQAGTSVDARAYAEKLAEGHMDHERLVGHGGIPSRLGRISGWR
jgi:hypothetical protein